MMRASPLDLTLSYGELDPPFVLQVERVALNALVRITPQTPSGPNLKIVFGEPDPYSIVFRHDRHGNQDGQAGEADYLLHKRVLAVAVRPYAAPVQIALCQMHRKNQRDN